MMVISSLERFPAETPRPALTAPPAVPAPSATAQPAVPSQLPSKAPQPASPSSDVRFELEDNDRVVIRISDPETGEIVRQIPSEVMLRVADMIADARGGTVDASA
ncbi:flagellar protein FlaG [Algiphilus sp.]|uniref:flagellar protein FlaG n=1 Tax=Algiphilus sp. TaxID=1872431 RepID=UPI003B51B4E7